MREICTSGSMRGERAAPQGVAFSPTPPRNRKKPKQPRKPMVKTQRKAKTPHAKPQRKLTS